MLMCGFRTWTFTGVFINSAPALGAFRRAMCFPRGVIAGVVSPPFWGFLVFEVFGGARVALTMSQLHSSPFVPFCFRTACRAHMCFCNLAQNHGRRDLKTWKAV